MIHEVSQWHEITPLPSMGLIFRRLFESDAVRPSKSHHQQWAAHQPTQQHCISQQCIASRSQLCFRKRLSSSGYILQGTSSSSLCRQSLRKPTTAAVTAHALGHDNPRKRATIFSRLPVGRTCKHAPAPVRINYELILNPRVLPCDAAIDAMR